MLRFYFHVNPDELDEEAWCEMVQDLFYVLNEVKGKSPNFSLT